MSDDVNIWLRMNQETMIKLFTTQEVAVYGIECGASLYVDLWRTCTNKDGWSWVIIQGYYAHLYDKMPKGEVAVVVNDEELTRIKLNI